LWSEAEPKTFLTWARANATRSAALYVTALATGARLGELLGLQWGQVDFVSGSIVIDRQLNETASGVVDRSRPTRELKTQRSRRTVPCEAGLLSVLKRHQEDAVDGGPSGFVFAGSSGRPQTRGNALRQFKRHAKAAGVPVLPFHCLRHMSATGLIESGQSPKLVQERLGHAR
jgi:integrase